jgi:hypothetical protein
VFHAEFYNGIPNVSVWLVLQKRLYLKAYKLSIVENLERRIVCTPVSINVFVTPATQQHLEYHLKAVFETACITTESHIEP